MTQIVNALPNPARVCPAHEIKIHDALGIDAVAHLAHAAGVLDAILIRAQVAQQAGARRVSVEDDRLEQRGKRIGSVVLPEPGIPMIRIFRLTSPPLDSPSYGQWWVDFLVPIHSYGNIS